MEKMYQITQSQYSSVIMYLFMYLHNNMLINEWYTNNKLQVDEMFSMPWLLHVMSRSLPSNVRENDFIRHTDALTYSSQSIGLATR